MFHFPSCQKCTGKKICLLNILHRQNFRKTLILSVPTPQNGQTHSNNSSVFASELLECV